MMDSKSDILALEKCKHTPVEITPAPLENNDSGYQSFGQSSSPRIRRRLRCHSVPAELTNIISPYFDDNSVVKQGVKDVAFHLPKAASRHRLRSLRQVPKLQLEEFVDFIQDLHPFPQVLSLILSYTSPRDLCTICCVSKVWKKACCCDKLAHRRRLEFLKQEALHRATVGKENLGSKRTPSVSSCSTPLQETGNVLTTSELASPAPVPQSQFQKFLQAGKSLPSDGRLTPCIHCSSPSQMSPGSSRASCTDASCAFVFCLRCWQQYQEPHICPRCKTPPRKTNTRISSKVSKKNLQRLAR